MTRTTRPERFGFGVMAVALSVTLTVALSGCTTIAGIVGVQAAKAATSNKAAHKAATVDASKPKTGDCWRSSYSDLKFADWNSAKPVSCGSPHQLYTYAVHTLPTFHSIPEFTDGYLTESIYQDASEVCQTHAISTYGLFSKLDGRIDYKVFVPRLVDWNKGARWVRCDIRVLAIGSRVSRPRLEDLPSSASIARLVIGETKDFNYCVNDPARDASAGPVVAGVVFADCSAHPDWTLVGRVDVSGTNTTFPSQADFARVNHDDCTAYYANSAATVVAIDPTLRQWKDEDHVMGCWSHSKAG